MTEPRSNGDGNGNGLKTGTYRLVQSVAIPVAVAAVVGLAAGWGTVVETITVQQQTLKHQAERIDETVKRIERLEQNIECIRTSLQSLDRGQAVILEKLSRMFRDDASTSFLMEDRCYESVRIVFDRGAAGGNAGGSVGRVRGPEPEGVHGPGG